MRDIVTEDIRLSNGKWLSHPPPGEEVVISGVAGQLPESKNIQEFQNNLYNKMDMITNKQKRYGKAPPFVPHRSGEIPSINKFDSGYFGMHKEMVDAMDPNRRIQFEAAIEAILDAGVNPVELEGTNTGVFLVSGASETQAIWYRDDIKMKNKFLGSMKSMASDTISHYLKLNGPSLTFDTACSSCLYALTHAYNEIRSGKIDAAIVGGVNLILAPSMTVCFMKLGILSEDGACKVFDKRADGYARGESSVTVFLQKANRARRIYAKVVHASVNCAGYNDKGITHPTEVGQKELLTEFYEQCGISPSTIDFVEAHGTGTTAGDAVEISPIDEIFCAKRKEPLLVGSVKTSVGHSESSAALSQVIKALLIFETGLIPPNLHIETPLEVEAFQSGRIVIPTEVTPYKSNTGTIAISSFGFGGSMGHCVLQSNEKRKCNKGAPEDALPRLICVGGRSQKGVNSVFDYLKRNALDSEFVALLHKIYKHSGCLDVHRGYSVLTKSGEVRRSVTKSNVKVPTIIMLFGGYSTPNVASDLLELPAFQQIIKRMDEVAPLDGTNLFRLLTRPSISNNTLIATVVQIATFEVFRMLGIDCECRAPYIDGKIPDAYTKRRITLNQALQLAVHLDTLNDKNSGDAVKLQNTTSPNFVNNRILENDVEFLLNAVFTKDDASLLNKYPTNCVLLSFEKTTTTMENGFHCDRAEEEDAMETLTFRFENGVMSLLPIIGRLYQLGHNPDVAKLYPPVEFPVSRGTPMISPLLKWDHRENWFVVSHNPRDNPDIFSLRFTVDPKDIEWSYVKGHVIDGRNLFPATGYLFLAWKLFSVLQKVPLGEMRVVFENVKLIRATTITDEPVHFVVSILLRNGDFEVTESDSVIATGRVRLATDADEINVECDRSIQVSSMNLLKEDVYKELKLRGYNYSDLFKGIEQYYPEERLGYINWEDENWVTCMDLMLQMYILPIETRNLYVPTQIQKVCIDAPKHLKLANRAKKILLQYVKHIGCVQAGYIRIEGFNASAIKRRKLAAEPILEKYEFIPNETTLKIEDSIRTNIQIILENYHTITVKVAELIDVQKDLKPVAPLIHQALSDLPQIQPDVRILSPFSLDSEGIHVENKNLNNMNNVSIVVAENLLARTEVLQEALKCLSENGFLISREPIHFYRSKAHLKDVELITIHSVPNETLVLLKRKQPTSGTMFIDMSQSSKEYDWLSSLQTAIANGKSVTLYAEKDPLNGILGFVNCLRKEPGGENIKCIFVQDVNAPVFDNNEKFYEKILSKGLAFNVYKDGKWGTYRHVKLQNAFQKVDNNCFVNPTVRGDLSSLAWIQKSSYQNTELDPEKEFISVYYSALNFKDIMLATNRLSANILDINSENDCPQGLEFSGKTKSGPRVMGLCEGGSLATSLAISKYFLLPVPDHWSLEDAATVPVVYATTLYAFSRANIRAGQSILIHAGAGGIGQAAINLALFYKLNVFTTVGTEEKREYIKKQYPMIKESHIGNSRDTTFVSLIYKETGGKGVDIVLNSLSEEMQLASLQCLAYGGAFLEIGKYDLVENNTLRLELLKKNAAFHGVFLDMIFSCDPRTRKTVMDMIANGISNGSVKPLRRTCFGENDVEEAYRYMAAGKHIGKVLLKIREEEPRLLHSAPSEKCISALPRYYCYSQYSYVITGGLGGFGLELADWLISRGARKLVLSSRVGLKTGYQQSRIRKWKNMGCQVLISTANILTKQGCKSLLEAAVALAPVAAIFNLAVVLSDALLENQTVETFCNCLAPKAYSVTYLDELSRRLCPKLRDFVVFSSVTCGRGTAGQTNYGMANSIMERICEKRRSDNLPALAIQWGAVGDVGLVVEMQKGDRELEIGGTLQQKILSCLDVMDRFMTEGNTIVSSMVVAEKRCAVTTSGNLVETIASMIGIKDLKTVSLHSTLPDLGMDSMMATDIKQYLEREVEIFLSSSDIRSLTFARLHDIMSEKTADQSTETSAVGNQSDSSATQIMDKLIPINANASIIKISKKMENAFPVVLLPGIESRLADFSRVANELRGQIWGVNYSHDAEIDTIEKESHFCLQNIRKSISFPKTFFIVAHSYGCLIALEIAALLEKEDHIGKIVLIDGSPKTASKALERRIGNKKGLQFEIMILEMMLSAVLRNVSQFTEQTKKCSTSEEIINIALEQLPPNLFSSGYLRQFIKDVQKRVLAVYQYKPSFGRIKSQVCLFKPKGSVTSTEAEDYGLSEITESLVQIRYLEGDHLTMLQDPKLGGAINKYFL